MAGKKPVALDPVEAKVWRKTLIALIGFAQEEVLPKAVAEGDSYRRVISGNLGIAIDEIQLLIDRDEDPGMRQRKERDRESGHK